MSAMYRLKAYFGMVPAEEMDYADEPDAFADPRRAPRARTDRWSDPDDRFDDVPDPRGGYPEYDAGRDERPLDDWNHRSAREPVRPARAPREPVRSPGGLSGGAGGGLSAGAPATRGALAVDREESVLRAAPEPPAPVAAPSSVPEQRDRGAAALARITTLQPSSFTEARTIGERYRDGVPVIINLTDLDEAAARRLVDFAAGLAFALRGSIDKVTSRVFLLTPADVEVSADDARRLAERGLFRQD
ncbi:cell division protein SepF [Pseudonocardia kujensis]|uniref:cell division protein SepF n=1 Tax=Pseudonocardia kujensis TaxID=1128675 RepID=UPI001E3D7B1B|nr:cell division protein SepF [Pseudonocardia kujensis]MCE0768549.1 cell division protein SepF [Pseudonocardia kujensis]